MQEESAAAAINPYPAGTTTSSVFHLARRFAAPSEAAEAAVGWGSAPCPSTSPFAPPTAGVHKTPCPQHGAL